MKQELEACGCLIRTKQKWNVEPGKYHVNSSGLKIISAADGLGPVAFAVEEHANLIAAAPELLESLKNAHSCLVAFKFIPGDRNSWEDHDEEVLSDVVAAIAKATGAV